MIRINEARNRRVALLKENPRLTGSAWEYYDNWLEEKTLGTRDHYLRYFIEFLEFLDTDTEKLYELYLGMIKDEDPRKRKKMGMLVTDYQKHMIDVLGLSATTTSLMVMAVKGFFDANELPLKVLRSIKRNSKAITNISNEQLHKMLSATGSYKLISFIKLARDSGLRVGDITNLPIMVLREPLDDPSIKYFTFEWKQEKTGYMANPVLGPDSLDALRMWMNYRVNTLKISAEDGDPLFCLERSKRKFTDKSNRNVRAIMKGGWMGNTAMGLAFKNLVKKACLKPLPSETKLPSIHSLRKYHKTTLEYAGIPTSWINKMQGRKGEGTGGIYTKPNPEQLIEMYKKGYSALTGIEEGQQEKIDSLTHELGLSQYEMSELRKEREKYRDSYELRTRLQTIIDNARLNGMPEELLKKLEENLESVETFEEGVFEFRKLKEGFEPEEEQSETWVYEVANGVADMTNYLNDGWKIFRELKDGSCILRYRKCQHSEYPNLEILNIENSPFPFWR